LTRRMCVMMGGAWCTAARCEDARGTRHGGWGTERTRIMGIMVVRLAGIMGSRSRSMSSC